MLFIASFNPAPCFLRALCLLTWRTNFFAHDGEYPSTFVSGLPTTAPPFASPQTLSHHSSGYFIYKDNISNYSRPRLEQSIVGFSKVTT
jgi:hypothetical protein